ncbi:MAG: MATE family efflux transporter [Bacteroidota bacterium]|nr:MATE family efflux transporter [Bacteroidota bacterium]
MFPKKYIKKLYTDIRLSISGNESDYTTGSISRAILLLSVPMILEMVMESIFAVADIFFVSKLGAEAVSAVGITESLMTIVYALGVGFSTGTAAIISRRIGQKNKEEASVVAVQSIIIAVSVSFIIAIVGLFFSSDLLRLMGASEKAIELGSGYAKIMLSSNVVIMLLFVINSVFRSAGDANISMKALWLANGINLILDPLLIFGWSIFPEMGVTGAATATLIGRSIAVIYQLYILLKGSRRIKVLKRHIRFEFDIIRKVLKVSLGGVAQHIIATSSWIFLVSIIASFGSLAVAGYTIAIRILLFSILPAWGMSNAAATLTGQNLGAGKPGRAECSIKYTTWANMVFLGFIAIILISFSESFIRFFIDDLGVIQKGEIGLRYISFSLFAYAAGMILMQAFNGSGMTQVPTLINFICFWLIEIPLAYYLSGHTDLNEKGVYYSIIVGDLVLTAIGVVLFLRGKWKTADV